MAKQKRIGPRMQAVLDFVKANPSTAKLGPARHVGPHGSLRYGYATVDRAIKSGLIEAKKLRGRYELRERRILDAVRDFKDKNNF